MAPLAHLTSSVSRHRFSGSGLVVISRGFMTAIGHPEEGMKCRELETRQMTESLQARRVASMQERGTRLFMFSKLVRSHSRLLTPATCDLESSQPVDIEPIIICFKLVF